MSYLCIVMDCEDKTYSFARLRGELSSRLHSRDIRLMSMLCADDVMKDMMYRLADDTDDRVAYNALWILTHLKSPHRQWLRRRRDELVDMAMRERHIGRLRLLLTLLEGQKISIADVRTDFLDFCLSKINSTEPYAVRALCLKQAFAQCRFYPELVGELTGAIELMGLCDLPPGLACARRNIMRKIILLNYEESSIR